MPAFHIDKRDLEFVLFEQHSLDALTELAPYKDMGREVFQMILDEAVRFSKEKLGPMNEIADRKGVQLVDGEVIIPQEFHDVWPEFVAGGWMAVGHTAEYGGMGLPMPLALIVGEAMIGACGSFMFFSGLTSGAGHLIEAFGSEELKKLYVERMYTGEWTGTMCLTEPQAGTALGDILTTATPIDDSETEFSIVGSKTFISTGDHSLTDNIVHLVLGRAQGDPAGTRGISLFVVPKNQVDANGKITGPNDIVCTALEHKMGIHASATCSLAFGDNKACRGWLVGERCKGLKYMFQMMNEARLITAIQGSAAANNVYQMSLNYARERTQGASVTDRSADPKNVAIIEHPDVRRNLMMSKAWGEGMRSLLVETAVYADLSRNHADEAVRTRNQDLLDLLTPICKAYCTDAGFKVTELGIQIHGGYGYIAEYGVEQAMRDVKIASLYEGTNGVQALDLLGRKMRTKGGALFMTWLQDANEFVGDRKDHPVLGGSFTAFDKAKNQLGATAMGLGAQGKKDMAVALSGATPFLEMFGHVCVAKALLDQAAIAHDKFEAIATAKGAEDTETRKALVTNNDEARFYNNKIHTARFFVDVILPQVKALAKGIESGNRDALDVIF